MMLLVRPCVVPDYYRVLLAHPETHPHTHKHSLKLTLTTSHMHGFSDTFTDALIIHVLPHPLKPGCRLGLQKWCLGCDNFQIICCGLAAIQPVHGIHQMN